MSAVLCGACGHECAAGAAFCSQCGASLAVACPGCGFVNGPAARFCSGCGSPLQGRTQAPGPEPLRTPRPPRPHVSAERRQLTVMFCDVVGSTALAERLDPEELHEVLLAYQRACSEEIARFEGRVAKYLGDGLVTFFGFPHAHEDDAERAVRAGLCMLEAIQRLNGSLQSRHGLEIAIRIGIHTGLVVAGDIGVDPSKAMDVVGETPNIAARLQEQAAPNSVVISAATCRLMDRRLRVEPLGERLLKGLSRPMELFRVWEVLDRDASVPHGTEDHSEIVGRTRELSQLLDAWHQASTGRGCATLLTGEPGIGKSCLKRAFKRHVGAGTPSTIIEMRCSSYHVNSAFFPIIQFLRDELLELGEAASDEEKLARVEALLERNELNVEENAPLLASLLSIDPGAAGRMLGISPELQRQRTLALLVEAAIRSARSAPVLIIIENVHWADPSTSEYISQLLDRLDSAAVMVLLTRRPGPAMFQEGQAHTAEIVLDRLPEQDTGQMIDLLDPERRIPESLRTQVLAKTDGVPLFVEEMVRMLLETPGRSSIRDGSGSEASPPDGGLISESISIPQTLNDLLMARLDRLGPAKELAQVAAVIGREFSTELLAVVSGREIAELQPEIRRLQQADLIHGSAEYGAPSFRFKHALILDCAYQSLLKSRRQTIHMDVARALEDHFPEITRAQPDLMAGHYQAAGQTTQAIQYWMMAGQRALQGSANVEAIAHFSRASDLVTSLQEDATRLPLELGVQANLGAAYSATRGYAASEVGAAFSRAYDLSTLFGDAPEIAPVVRGLWGYNLVRSQFEPAEALSKQLLRMGELTGDTALLVEGNLAFGTTLFWQARLESSQSYLERVLELDDPGAWESHAVTFLQSPSVTALCYLANILWYRGYPDTALEKLREAEVIAHRLKHPLTLAWTSVWPATLRMQRLEPEATLKAASEAITFCTEQGYPYWMAHAGFYLGWAQHRLGEKPEGTAKMRDALALFAATGSRICTAYYQGYLAETLALDGNLVEAAEMIDAAMELAVSTQEWVSELDLFRVKGEMLLLIDPNDHDQAERVFREGVDRARKAGAQTRLLQASVPLARLLAGTGRGSEAAELLEEVLAPLTEGFGTSSYREAGSLLAELRGAA